MTFGIPDKIPFCPGNGRESTLARWHKEGMPQDRSQSEYVREVLGIELETTKPVIDIGIDFLMIPQFEEKILEHKDGHYICQDWKGNICEISDKFDLTYLRTGKDFVTRRWIKCPVENRADWQQMKERYDSNAPGRFVSDFAARCRQAQDRDWLLGLSFYGPFWQLREWCGFEGLCMMMVEQPDLVEEMADFWTQFISAMLDKVLAHIVPDHVLFSEDMAYKEKAMISPAMTRLFCMPGWKKWCHQLRSAGCPVIDVDSDGYIGELIPLWIESGFNACNPIEVAANCDIVNFRKQFGHSMAYSGGVDKRCIAQGGAAIRKELERIKPVINDGGYIPGCDHGVPSDVSLKNFLDYCRLLAKMTGWL
jgi:uroporphyrinogen decarboxylase